MMTMKTVIFSVLAVCMLLASGRAEAGFFTERVSPDMFVPVTPVPGHSPGSPKMVNVGGEMLWKFAPPYGYIRTTLELVEGCRILSTSAKVQSYDWQQEMEYTVWVYPSNPSGEYVFLGTLQLVGGSNQPVVLSMQHNYILKPGDQVHLWVKGYTVDHLAYWAEFSADCP